jgi:hypothetical protein
MSNGDRKTRLPTMTPLPIEDLQTVSRNLIKVGTAVTRIEGAVSTIKDVMLPPVADAAKEARDGVLTLNGRVTALESKPPPEYSCSQLERQQQQDTEIAETREKASGLSRLIWWFFAIAGVAASAAIGFAITSTVFSSSAQEQLEDLDGLDTEVAKHGVKIKALEEAQARDRTTYIKHVKNIPAEVEQAVQSRDPTIEEIEHAAEDLPLTTWERDMIKRIMSKARGRNERADGNR